MAETCQSHSQAGNQSQTKNRTQEEAGGVETCTHVQDWRAAPRLGPSEKFLLETVHRRNTFASASAPRCPPEMFLALDSPLLHHSRSQHRAHLSISTLPVPHLKEESPWGLSYFSSGSLPGSVNPYGRALALEELCSGVRAQQA